MVGLAIAIGTPLLGAEDIQPCQSNRLALPELGSKQLCRLDAQPSCQSINSLQASVPLTALNAADIVPVEARPIGQLFLAKPSCGAQQAHRSAKSEEVRIRHMTSVAGLRPTLYT